jgi:hypothetical protein
MNYDFFSFLIFHFSVPFSFFFFFLFFIFSWGRGGSKRLRLLPLRLSPTFPIPPANQEREVVGAVHFERLGRSYPPNPPRGPQR